ncbi:MAG: hypothetical protein ACPG19_06455 [Saprospiraceae bacterium]
MNIQKIPAYIISVLLHPLLLVSYSLIFLMWVDPFNFGSPSFKIAIQTYDLVLIRIFFSTALLPGLSILMMKFLGMLETLEMKDKQERIGPYIATGVFYLWIFFNINSNPQLPDTFKTFVLGATVALFIAFFINNFSKISIYTVGAGTLIGLVLMNWVSIEGLYLGRVLQGVFLLAGALGTARLALRSEEPADIYGGYVIGLMGQFVGFLILDTFF